MIIRFLLVLLVTGALTPYCKAKADRYTLAVTASPANTAFIELNPGPGSDGKYAAGTVVAVEAIPVNPPNRITQTFGYWTGDYTGTSNPVSITMNSNMSLVAHIVTTAEPLTRLDLTASPAEGGTIAASPPPTPAGYYRFDTQVSVTAEPKPGFTFHHFRIQASGWFVPFDMTNNPYQFKTSNDTRLTTIQAFFVRPDARDPADDSWAHPTVLNVPTSVAQSDPNHYLTWADIHDWFRIYLTAGVPVYFNTAGGEGDDYAELFTEKGEKLVENDNGAGNGQFGFNFTPLISGNYLLRVRARTAGLYCAYNLKYNIVKASSGRDAWDPADDSSNGATVLPDPASERTGGERVLSNVDLYDWYKVRLVSGRRVKFYSSGTGDNYAELFSKAGRVLASNDNGAGNGQFSLSYMPTTSDYYFLRVRAKTPGEGCSYTMKYLVATSAVVSGPDWLPYR